MMIKHIGTISKEDFKSKLLVIINRLQNIFGFMLFITPVIWLIFLNGWIKTKAAPPEVVHEFRNSICALIDSETGASYCTGSLIMDNIILTAGHCLNENEIGDTILLNFTELEGYQMIKATIVYNPYDSSLDSSEPNDDYAILKTTSKLNIKPIQIITSSEISEPFNPDVEFYGFPIIAAGESTEINQSKVKSNVVNYNLADETLFLIEGGYKGTSGAPIIINLETTGNEEQDNKIENKRVIGIVKGGIKDGDYAGQTFAEKTTQLIDNINIPDSIWDNEFEN